MSRIAVATLSVLLLAGCATPQAYQGIDYASTAPTRLNVGAVLIDSAFKPAGQAPNVEHQLTPQPEDVLRTAITQHYQVVHANHPGLAALRFTIKDAHVIEEVAAQPTNFFSQLTSDHADYRYTGRLEVESRTEGSSRRGGFVHAEATRVLEVKDVANPEARARLVQGMVAQMVDDVMVQLDQQINTNLSGYVIAGVDETIVPEPSGRWDHVHEDRVARSAGLRVITTK